jgi:hypothetical protein
VALKALKASKVSKATRETKAPKATKAKMVAMVTKEIPAKTVNRDRQAPKDLPVLLDQPAAPPAVPV